MTEQSRNFNVFGVSFRYPVKWQLKVTRLTERQGELEMTKQSEERGRDVFEAVTSLGWRPSQEVLGKYPTIDAYVRGVSEKLRKSYRNFQVLSEEKVQVSGHVGFLSHMRLTPSRGLFARKAYQMDRLQFILNCDQSTRILVMSTIVASELLNDYEPIFRGMVSSLACHEGR